MVALPLPCSHLIIIYFLSLLVISFDFSATLIQTSLFFSFPVLVVVVDSLLFLPLLVVLVVPGLFLSSSLSCLISPSRPPTPPHPFPPPPFPATTASPCTSPRAHRSCMVLVVSLFFSTTRRVFFPFAYLSLLLLPTLRRVLFLYLHHLILFFLLYHSFCLS